MERKKEKKKNGSAKGKLPESDLDWYSGGRRFAILHSVPSRRDSGVGPARRRHSEMKREEEKERT